MNTEDVFRMVSNHRRATLLAVALTLALYSYFYPFPTPEACGRPGIVMSSCVAQPAAAVFAIVFAAIVLIEPKVIFGEQ